jgi:hypothetical protein
MKNSLFTLFILFIANFAIAQKNKNQFSLEINYGLNGNFFVRGYEEIDNGPANKSYFYKKDFIGSAAGAEIRYNISPRSSLLFGFANTINQSVKNYFGNFNGVDVSIQDFHISHQNQFYQFGYDGIITKKLKGLRFNIGVVYSSIQQQLIALENFDNFINIRESNFRNSNLEEGGFFGGLSMNTKIDSKFVLGIKVKGYYLASGASFEAITLTPTLSYFF